MAEGAANEQGGLLVLDAHRFRAVPDAELPRTGRVVCLDVETTGVDYEDALRQREKDLENLTTK